MQIDQAIVLENENVIYADNPNNDNKEIKLKSIEEPKEIKLDFSNTNLKVENFINKTPTQEQIEQTLKHIEIHNNLPNYEQIQNNIDNLDKLVFSNE